MKIYVGRTMIGSHIWKMNTPKSDKDYFEVYTEDIEDILNHTAKYKSDFIQTNKNGRKVDVHLHEVSHVVEQLLKGNINFIIGMLSPIVRSKSDAFMELRELTRKQLAKNCFYSINGMAEGNYIKYIKEGRDTSERKCNQILRTIQMGIKILNGKRTGLFEPYSGGTADEILEKLSELRKAYNDSPLPEKPDEPKFRCWLLDFRKEEIKHKIDYGLWYI